MTWNWQYPEWPNFEYNLSIADAQEKQFLLKSGSMFTIFSCLEGEDKDRLCVQLLSEEAIQTSKIEGEILDRDSVQSSIQRHFGLKTDPRRVPPAEQGISELLMDMIQDHSGELTEKRLQNWHNKLMQGRRDIIVGAYRSSEEPMQVVSGSLEKTTVHYEAPPAMRVPEEVKLFLSWFKESKDTLPALTRSAIAHVYFESIHPFDDGNGRIGRAISELALSQSIGQPVFLALSQTIESHKKRYYHELQKVQQQLKLDDWIQYFSETILEAQATSLAEGEFLIAKTKFLDRFRNKLNQRQEKVLLRMFREGVNGFKGGLSASNYISITGATRVTASRDLSDLVKNNALKKTGERRYTRYFLNM